METITAVRVLKERIAEAEAVLNGAQEPTFQEWKTRARLTLVRVFGEDHALVREFDETRYTLSVWTDGTPKSAWGEARDSGVRKVVSLLKAAVYEREELSLPITTSAGDIDPELWAHVAHLVEAGQWGQVASQAAIFVESHVRQWAGLSDSKFGKALMVAVFKPTGGRFPCGTTDSEELGWQQLATGFVQAVSNVDRHRIQHRPDARTYAMGVLGTASLLLTQLRYQHDSRFHMPIDTIE